MRNTDHQIIDTLKLYIEACMGFWVASLFVGQCRSQNFILGRRYLWAHFTDEKIEAARDCEQIAQLHSAKQTVESGSDSGTLTESFGFLTFWIDGLTVASAVGSKAAAECHSPFQPQASWLPLCASMFAL